VHPTSGIRIAGTTAGRWGGPATMTPDMMRGATRRSVRRRWTSR
jgi:hypothetical protein